MKYAPKFSPAARISVGLVFVTAAILLLADAIGVTPSASGEVLDARKKFCEVLAVVFSTAAQNDDLEIIEETMRLAVGRQEDLLSMALRVRSGDVIAAAGDHDTHWRVPKDGMSTATHWQVPIIRGTEQWGNVEVAYAPMATARLLGVPVTPLVGLLLFVSLTGFVAYRLLMRKALRHLDPSAVIPHHVQTTLDVLAEGVAIFDKSAQIVLANSAFSRNVSRAAGELLGKRADEIGFSPPALDDGSHEFPWVRAIADGQSRLGVKLTWEATADEVRTYIVNGAPVLDDRGRVQGALATFDDLTQVEEKNVQLEQMLDLLKASRDEVKRQNEQLHILATRDPLTGCLNRRAFFKEFEELFAGAQAESESLACIMTDIDHFKSFNDRYGHAVGDEVIKRVAKCLQSTLRDNDRLCRYGGEEFCIVLPGLDAIGGQRVAERIRRMIESQNDDELLVTSSFGVSDLSCGAVDPAQLIDQADQALYRAKESGRNVVVGWADPAPAAPPAELAATPPPKSRPVAKPSVQAPAGDAGGVVTPEHHVFDLEEDKRWHGEMLEILASMGDFYSDSANPSGPQGIYAGTRRHLRGLLQCEVTAFIACDEQHGEFRLVDCEPAAHRQVVEQEFARLTADGTLERAMSQSNPVQCAATSRAGNVFIHALATESRPMGLFVGLLGEGVETPDYAKCNIVSVIMNNTARALESAELYRLLRSENALLERSLGERTRELQHGRVHDELTGLPNRVLFCDRIAEGVKRSKRFNTIAAVLMLDLDRFKRVNKLLGHSGGDRLLKDAGERINTVVRATDSVARIHDDVGDALISRLGGDEFGILLTDLDGVEGIRIVVNRLLRALSKPFVVDGRELFITTGIGISLYPADGEDSEALMRNAEAAMYQSKATGRNSYKFFCPDTHEVAVRQLDLEDRMRVALQSEQFQVHYQPKVSVETGRITGFEALLRWHDAVLGAVSPAEFIPAAEVSGLIVPVGSWVLRQACRHAKDWVDRGHSDVRVAVNLSAIQILQSEIVEEINAALDETGLPPHALEVEITESTIMHQIDRAAAILSRLADAGIRIAIDDFGTGYSSLNHLKRFPVDSLKIDGSFIRDLVADSSDAAIVKATVAMAHGLGVSTVAECVETQEQMSLIRMLDCDEVQGYFFSKPVPFEDAMELLACWQGDDTLLWQAQGATG